EGLDVQLVDDRVLVPQRVCGHRTLEHAAYREWRGSVVGRGHAVREGKKWVTKSHIDVVRAVKGSPRRRRLLERARPVYSVLKARFRKSIALFPPSMRRPRNRRTV